VRGTQYRNIELISERASLVAPDAIPHFMDDRQLSCENYRSGGIGRSEAKYSVASINVPRVERPFPLLSADENWLYVLLYTKYYRQLWASIMLSFVNENRVSLVIPTVGLLASCAAIPQMPPDYTLPISEIIHHAVCELRFAFQDIGQTNPNFGANSWAISVTLTPKVESELSARAGLTGKTNVNTQKFFNSWVVGAAPGAEVDVKGHRDGTVAYVIHSRDLLNEKKFPLVCDIGTSHYHELANNLGIRNWLGRIADAAEGDVEHLIKLDKPTFNSQIVIKFDGAGNFTYNFPHGTDFGGAFASYFRDESLAIALTNDPDPARLKWVNTLPKSAGYSSIIGVARSPISALAQQNLDLLRLEQTLKDLQVQTPIHP
jgi:hypothetical protein